MISIGMKPSATCSPRIGRMSQLPPFGTVQFIESFRRSRRLSPLRADTLFVASDGTCLDSDWEVRGFGAQGARCGLINAEFDGHIQVEGHRPPIQSSGLVFPLPQCPHGSFLPKARST